MSEPERFVPGSVWSLWDMIERYGDLVKRAINSLDMAETFWPLPEAGKVALATNAVPLELKQGAAAAAISAVRELAFAFGWVSLEPQIARLEDRLSWNSSVDAIRDFRVLRERIQDELKHEFLFLLDRHDVSLFQAAEPFGPKVTAKFPLAAEDVAEAAKCIAMQRPTASVFHLMRAMEGAVQHLGRLLKVRLEPKKETWFNICNLVSKALAVRAAKTKRQSARNAALGAAVAHLQTVRIASRNEVMHPKQTYTMEEAQEVFSATRVFMIDLAGLI